MTESIFNTIATYTSLALSICLIFVVLFLTSLIRGLKNQIKQDENLFDRYNDLVGKLADKVSTIERRSEANVRSLEYIENLNNQHNKELYENMALLEKKVYEIVEDRLDRSIARLEKITSLQNSIDIPVKEPAKTEEKKEEPVNKAVKYEWKYCDEVNERPVTGEAYMVVGRVKGASEMDVDCEPANYGENGKFYNKDGTPFDKVFAYIRMPQASDIQDRLFTLLKKDMRASPGKVTYSVIKTPGK